MIGTNPHQNNKLEALSFGFSRIKTPLLHEKEKNKTITNKTFQIFRKKKNSGICLITK